MTRRLYSALLRLYPRPFREEYGEEMLSVFDQAPASRRPAFLLETAVAVVRRRFTSPQESATPSSGLSLYTTPAGALSVRAVVPGIVVSAGLFGLISWAIAHGAPSGEMRLPQVIVEPTDLPSAAFLTLEEDDEEEPWYVSFLAAFDDDGDGAISDFERMAIRDERLRDALAAADFDRNHIVTLEEMERADALGLFAGRLSLP